MRLAGKRILITETGIEVSARRRGPLSLVPVSSAAATRLFDNLGADPRRPQKVEVVEAPGVTHLRYRFLHDGS